MVLPNSAVYICLFWIFLILFDKKCKDSRYCVHYHELLQRWGLLISSFHIQYKTTIFNRFFTKLGRFSPKFLTLWFNLGIVFGVLAMFLTGPLLGYFIIKTYKEPNGKKVLQPVMPGVNLPWNQLSYYITTLLITGAFHEMGHAIAAIRENVKVNSFGVFLFLLYPGAFVELNTVQLELISPIKRLRIYTAGVWHNFVLALVSLGLLSILPFCLVPFYHANKGVVVTWINPKFTISSQLQYGYVVNSVNRCPVIAVRDWYRCLQRIQDGPTDGYCNALTYVKTLNSSLGSVYLNAFNEPDCCNDTTMYRFCYLYNREYVNQLLELKSKNFDITVKPDTGIEHACLPGRLTMSSKPPCNDNKDCKPKNLCLKPLTSDYIKVVRISHAQGQDILFVGNPQELLTHLMISDFVPKNAFISPTLPGQLSLLLKYLFSISAALAMLNMVPCTYLDGHQVLCTLLLVLFPNSTSLRPKLEIVLTIFCSCLLTFVLLLAFYSLFIDKFL